jgi:hypothetical protein
MSKKYKTEDSGKRQSFKSGAVRDTLENKTLWDLMPIIPLKRIAALYTRGAIKYDPDNWKKGIPSSRFMSSAIRHLNEYRYIQECKKLGIEIKDAEILKVLEEDHLSAVIFNLLAIMYNEDVNCEWHDI